MSIIYEYLSEAILRREKIEIERFFTSEDQEKIKNAFEKVIFLNLSGVKELWEESYEYGELKVFLAFYTAYKKSS